MDFSNTNTIEIPTPSTTETLIRIPDGVECIPELHYLGCDQLEIIYIPTTVRKIEDYAFKGCSRLKMVYIPEGVTTIGVGCFCDCVDLNMVHIPHSVREIKKEAFKQCKKLCSVTLPPQLQCISEGCFSECRMLNCIIIPSTVTSIGTKAFLGCFSLREITFPNNMIKLSLKSFKECFRLKKITFVDPHTNTNSRVPRLGKEAFMSCKSLVEINLSCYPVYTLKEYCFNQCEKLERIILSKETKKLMNLTFCECLSLKYIGYETTLESKENDETTFGLDLKHIDSIGWAAFVNCTSLKSVRLYEHNVIQPDSFAGCTNLETVSLPPFIRLVTDIYGKKLCNYFDSDNIKKLILPLTADRYSKAVIFYVMYKIIKRNQNLLTKEFTPENLYPFEVVNVWLHRNKSDDDIPDDDWIINMLYFYIRKTPHLLKIYM